VKTKFYTKLKNFTFIFGVAPGNMVAIGAIAFTIFFVPVFTYAYFAQDFASQEA